MQRLWIWTPKRRFRKFGVGKFEWDIISLAILIQFLSSICMEGVAAELSELLDVEWNESPSSSDFFKQLKEAMGNDNINSHQLSMRFNVDVYVGDSEQSNFTTGRISGLILNNSYNQYLCLMLTFLLYAYYVLLCFGLIYEKRKLIVIKRQKISFLGL